MFTVSFILFILFSFVFLVKSDRLMLSVLMLEILGLTSLFATQEHIATLNFSESASLFLFSILVLGGVLVLSGAIMLVAWKGVDYIVSYVNTSFFTTAIFLGKKP